jgi:glycosyltransferase involved in cell wall biosynthesis
MNIWFTADIHPELPGGVATSIRYLSEGLRQKGHAVTVISRKTIRANNYMLFAVKLGIYFVLKFLRRPDWIIARSTDAIVCALLIRLFKLKTKTVLYNHGWEELVYRVEKRLPGSLVAHPTTWKSHCVRFPLLRLTYRLSTCCISGTVHETRIVNQQFSSLGVKCRYIPNGVLFQETPYWCEREEYPPYFIVIGNMTWKKNTGHSIEVFNAIKSQIPEARLICIGMGLNTVPSRQQSESLNEGITYLPVVSHETMHLWYTTCPYILVSSRYEGGHSLALLEAMSFGIIGFVSAIPSNLEIIRNGLNGFSITGCTVSRDAEKIVQCMRENNLLTIRKRAANTARRNQWSRQIRRLENVLRTPG